MVEVDPSSDNRLTIKEKVNDVYIDLAATYANVVAYLYDSTNDLIKKWSREAQTGYESLYVVDAYTLEFYIERGFLTAYKGGKVTIEVKTVETVASKGLTNDEEHLLASGKLSVGKSNMGVDA